MPAPAFHLSIGVRSLEESVDFFVRVLEASVTRRDPSGYVDLDLYGAQITLAETSMPAAPADFHFGVNLDPAELARLEAHVLASGHPVTVKEGARRKLLLRCPSGHLLEFKGVASP